MWPFISMESRAGRRGSSFYDLVGPDEGGEKEEEEEQEESPAMMLRRFLDLERLCTGSRM